MNLGLDVHNEVSGIDKPFAAVEETKLKYFMNIEMGIFIRGTYFPILSMKSFPHIRLFIVEENVFFTLRIC